LRLELPLPSGFSFDAVVRSHGWYDLAPFAYDRAAGVLTYVTPGPTPLSFRGISGRLEVSGPGRRSAALAAVVRRIFSLDLDLSGFDAMLGEEPVLRRALARGGGRMLRAATLFEDGVKMRDAILAEHGFGPYAAEGLMRILGRHEYLAIDSWVRKQFRKLHPGPAKTVDRAIARRYARYGGYRGLAMWLELTRDWHEGDDPNWGGSAAGERRGTR